MDCTSSSKNMNNLPWLLTAYQGHRHTRRGYKWLWLHTSFTAIWIDLTTGFATEDSGRDQKANCEWTRAFWSPSLNFVPICLVSMDDFPVPYSYMLMLQDWPLTVEEKLEVAVVMTVWWAREQFVLCCLHRRRMSLWSMDLHLGIPDVNPFGKKSAYTLSFGRHSVGHFQK